MKDYRLDRTSFRMQSFKEADNHRDYWLSKSPYERFCSAWYLICSSYNLPYRSDLRLDRSCFKMSKRG